MKHLLLVLLLIGCSGNTKVKREDAAKVKSQGENDSTPPITGQPAPMDPLDPVQR